jgi:hypothetical protein
MWFSPGFRQPFGRVGVKPGSMIKFARWWMPGLIVPAAATFLALAAGCSSDSGPSRRERAEMLRRLPPPLAGQATYFDGQILVQLRLGSGLRPMAEADSGTGATPASGGRHHGGMGHGSGGGGMHAGGSMGGGGMEGSGMGEGGPGGGDQGVAMDPAAEGDEAPRGASHLHVSNAPPVMVHIDLTNKGATAATVSVTDFSSPLGNFVVFPDHLDLAPGQTAAFEPMTSSLGDDFSEVSITLTMHLGSRTEKQVVTLHQVTPPAQPPAPPASN